MILASLGRGLVNDNSVTEAARLDPADAPDNAILLGSIGAIRGTFRVESVEDNSSLFDQIIESIQTFTRIDVLTYVAIQQRTL